MKIKLSWPDMESWREYGHSNKYENRHPKSLSHSEDKEERSWHNKGTKKSWIKDFKFSKLRENKLFESFQQWKLFGIDKAYNSRNPTSLEESPEITDRRWYALGQRKGWIKKFNFSKKRKDDYEDYGEWEKEGKKKKYYNLTPTQLRKSDNKEERSWYNNGIRRNWSKSFKYANRQNQKTRGFWQNWENVEDEIKRITTQLGSFPTQSQLLKLNYGGLLTSIARYQGGLTAVKKRMGYDNNNNANQLENLLENYVGGSQ